MNGNMTYWRGDELRTCIMARMLMEMVTQRPKQEAVFGSDQIPQEHGGGPWFAAARACFEPSRFFDAGNELQHVEVTIKGLTQLTKTPEIVCQAFFCFFAQGVLPNIMVRNKGGANVGTNDMCNAVREMNRDIDDIYDRIIKLYSHHPHVQDVKKTDFHLDPRCTSDKQFLEFHERSYALRHPQVLISCTNVTAIKRMTQTPTGRQLGASMRMSLIELLSGYRCEEDDVDDNPHAPNIWDVDKIPLHLCEDGHTEDGHTGPTEITGAAMALLFDEDDSNRSSTGSEKTDKLLHTVCPELKDMVNDMVALREAYNEEHGIEIDYDEEDGEEEGEELERLNAQESKFFKRLANQQLRAKVAAVYGYTATPMTLIHEAQNSASKVNHIMIELKPGKNYVGYLTERSRQKYPWLKEYIKIEELPNRVRRENLSLKDEYPCVMRKYVDPDFGNDGKMPFPFNTNEKNGTITLNKKNEDEEIPCRIPLEPGRSAGWIRSMAKEAVKASKVRMTQFWREDGVNVVKVLRDMHEKKDAYPEGYRNFLYMTNFSRSQKGQELVVRKLLALQEEDLVKGIICMEYTHKHIRYSWRVAKNADGTPSVDAGLFLQAAASLERKYSDDALACTFSKSAQTGLAQAREGEIQTLTVTVSNINWGYSVLWEYMTRMRERDPAFFLKMMVVAGDIGGRGVRYKTAKTHQFVLTDMFHAFVVSPKHQIAAHGTGTIQAIGRLCTMAKDIETCPTIKLWVPQDCWKLIELWMEAFDHLTDLLDYKRENHLLTVEEALARMTQDRTPEGDARYPHFNRLFTAPTGRNSKGEALYARSSHLNTPSKQLSQRLATDPKCVPVEPLKFNDRQEEMKAELAEHALDTAAAKQAMEEDEMSEAAQGPLPPVAPGEVSIPEPPDLPCRTVPCRKRNNKEASGPSDSWPRKERWDMLEDMPEVKKVFNIVWENHAVEVGIGYGNDDSGKWTGNDMVDPKSIEQEGATVQRISEKLAQMALPGHAPPESTKVQEWLKRLVKMGFIQVSSNFPALKHLRKNVHYWALQDKGRYIMVDEDPLENSQGSAAKRPRPRKRQ